MLFPIPQELPGSDTVGAPGVLFQLDMQAETVFPLDRLAYGGKPGLQIVSAADVRQECLPFRLQRIALRYRIRIALRQAQICLPRRKGKHRQDRKTDADDRQQQCQGAEPYGYVFHGCTS